MEVLPFGFLVFVSMTLLLVNAWGVIDAKLATTSASREAVRAFVEAPDALSATTIAAQRAEEALEAYGHDGGRATVDPPLLTHGFVRCGRVSVTVSYDVPALAIPFIGGFGQVVTVRSTSTELIDPFRDGVPGIASC